jgi:hypothetical protein
MRSSTLEDKNPWYRIAEADEILEQGDFIDNCKVLIPTYIPVETETGVSENPQVYRVKGVEQEQDVVIISQSCDLENGKIEFVHLCPRISCSKWVALAKGMGHTDNTIYSNLNAIRLGKIYKYCMLGQCNLTDFTHEVQIVDLSIDHYIPYDIMNQMAKSGGNRIRLLSPFKEYLAQAYGYFHMRVALPNSIPEFVKPKAPTPVRF